MTTDVWFFWLHGSRYGEMPISYYGMPAIFCAFAIMYFLMVALAQILDNPKQKYLW